jgi:1-deoxy-D-xylulose-5-phosphate reductoisomerase
MESICLLGATGSIGSSTLDIVRQHPQRFRVQSVSGFSNIQKLAEIINEFSVNIAVVPNDQSRTQIQALIPKHVVVLTAEAGLIAIASDNDVDMVVAAIVGAAGLTANLAAAQAGKKILLANKESLVVAGHLFMQAVAENNALLLPLDSEHNAIFQCFPQDSNAQINKQGIEKILLTASGGPFRQFSIDQIKAVTPEQACAHPNWSMGQKISVDSASLMNKGLELIEACWLFDVKPKDIQVVVHPQSIIHSMVSYKDGSVLAQMGNPDMRTPIAYAMAWPERIVSGVKPLDLFDIARLDFESANEEKFPCLRLAKDAMATGGTLPAVLNAANEITNAAFLNRQIGFMDIAGINEKVMHSIKVEPVEKIEQLLQLDTQARQKATELIGALK